MTEATVSNPGTETKAAQPPGWGWAPIILLVGAFIIMWLRSLVTRKPKPRVFISFAFKDGWARNFLVKQSRFEKTSWTLEDGSLHVPFSERTWKREVRPMIEECKFLLLLIGKDTWRAQGAIWEVERARASGIPIIGMHIFSKGEKRGTVPECMSGERIINWTFDELKEVMASYH